MTSPDATLGDCFPRGCHVCPYMKLSCTCATSIVLKNIIGRQKENARGSDFLTALL